MSAIGVLSVAVALFVTGASVLRIYISDGRILLLVAALTIFTLGNILMVRLMRETGGMGTAMSLATVGQLVAANAVAFLFFGERPGTLQLLGIGLGVVAIGLILLPTVTR
jgi:small multidrug resistance pump